MQSLCDWLKQKTRINVNIIKFHIHADVNMFVHANAPNNKTKRCLEVSHVRTKAKQLLEIKIQNQKVINSMRGVIIA